MSSKVIIFVHTPKPTRSDDFLVELFKEGLTSFHEILIRQQLWKTSVSLLEKQFQSKMRSKYTLLMSHNHTYHNHDRTLTNISLNCKCAWLITLPPSQPPLASSECVATSTAFPACCVDLTWFQFKDLKTLKFWRKTKEVGAHLSEQVLPLEKAALPPPATTGHWTSTWVEC